MKLIINKDENYEIKIPNEIEGKEFLELTEKLIKLSKFMQVNSVNINNPQPNVQPTIRKYLHNGQKYDYTKEKVMDILQYYYFGTREDKLRICKIVNVKEYNDLAKRFNGFIKRFSIKPSEVGLISFGTINHSRVKMSNWIIKSHTGIFDENENEN